MAMTKLLGRRSRLLLLLFLFLTAICVEGREFIVGGRVHAWKVPLPAQQSLNHWASSMRFQVGDSLVWILGGSQKDSVLEVTRSDYLSCNTSSPIADHTYGTARVKLDRPGPYYFISGINGACSKGEKLAVVVMASTSSHGHSTAPSPSPSPSPSPLMGLFDVLAPSPLGFDFHNGPAAAQPTGSSGVSGMLVGANVVGLTTLLGLGLLLLLLC